MKSIYILTRQVNGMNATFAFSTLFQAKCAFDNEVKKYNLTEKESNVKNVVHCAFSEGHKDYINVFVEVLQLDEYKVNLDLTALFF